MAKYRVNADGGVMVLRKDPVPNQAPRAIRYGMGEVIEFGTDPLDLQEVARLKEITGNVRHYAPGVSREEPVIVDPSEPDGNERAVQVVTLTRAAQAETEIAALREQVRDMKTTPEELESFGLPITTVGAGDQGKGKAAAKTASQ